MIVKISITHNKKRVTIKLIKGVNKYGIKL